MKLRTWIENLRWSREKWKKKKKNPRKWKSSNQNQKKRILPKTSYAEKQRAKPRDREAGGETEKEKKGWERKKKLRLERRACIRQSERERHELELSEVSERVTEWGRVTVRVWDESEAESLRSNEAWDWECLGVRILGLAFLLTKTT